MWIKQKEGGEDDLKFTKWQLVLISVVWGLGLFGSSYSRKRVTVLAYSILCAFRTQLKEDGETGQTSFNLDFYGCQLGQTKIQLLYGCQTGLIEWERYLLWHNKVETSSLVKNLFRLILGSSRHMSV